MLACGKFPIHGPYNLPVSYRGENTIKVLLEAGGFDETDVSDQNLPQTKWGDENVEMYFLSAPRAVNEEDVLAQFKEYNLRAATPVELLMYWTWGSSANGYLSPRKWYPSYRTIALGQHIQKRTWFGLGSRETVLCADSRIRGLYHCKQAHLISAKWFERLDQFAGARVNGSPVHSE